MSRVKSREFIDDSDSSDSDDNFVPQPVTQAKPKAKAKPRAALSDSDEEEAPKKKSKKDKKEKKRDKTSKVVKPKKEKRKRELSPPSDDGSLSPPPAKKMEKKPKKEKGPAKKEAKDVDSMIADVSNMINIGINRYVGITEFRGKKYLNIREYYEDSVGLKPGKKGVALVQDQWNNLRDSFFDIDDKIHTATDEDFSPIDIGKNKRVRVTKFKKKFLLIDIREVYLKDGEEMPGKKGIALKPEQYGKIKEMADEIDNMWR